MATRDRAKWDEKYRGRPPDASERPPDWLILHLPELPQGRSLDLACGLGSAAIALARSGRPTLALDISPVAIHRASARARRDALPIDWLVADLDRLTLPTCRFDLITVFYYLDRARLPTEIVRALRPGGMLVFETYSVDQLALPGNHITNPDHLLGPGELLTLFAPLRVRHYREVTLTDRAIASLVAEKVVSSPTGG